jgi:hypothetical protein
MKAFNALILSIVAGISTFGVQHFLFPAQLHAAAFAVPRTLDWRQRMIDHDPGGAIVDRMAAHWADKLDLTAAQTNRLRPLLEQQHKRILALLLSGPATLTRDEFVQKRQEIRDQTFEQLDPMLSPDQRELAKELRRPPTA